MEKDTQQPEIKQPDLEASIQALNLAMEDDPTSEKPLDALIQVEEALRSMLQIKELSRQTKAQIDDVLIVLTGKTISGFLDDIHEKAMKAMESGATEVKEDLEGYLEKLKIVYRKVERVILNPDEKNDYITGSGYGIDKKELQTNKLQYLLELLRANEIYTDDICIVIGENTPNMMREGSYLYIEIPKVKRTILFHLGYGEATFVLYDIYDRVTVFDMTKEQIQEKLGAAKVDYSERDLNKWGLQMLEALRLNETSLQPKINMENYDKRLFYIEEIKKLYPTPEEFMALTQKQKTFLKINGKGLKFVATVIFGNTAFKPVALARDMALLAREIYGFGYAAIECEFWDKEKWIEELKKTYPTPEEFLALKSSQRQIFNFFGKGLIGLATIIIGNQDLHPAGKKYDLAVLAEAIYGKGQKVIEDVFKEDEINNLTAKLCVEEIKRNYPTPEDFMSLTQKQQAEFRFMGKGLTNLSTLITGKTWLKPVQKLKDLAVLAEEIYGKDHIVIECVSWDKERWKEEIKKLYKTSGELTALNIEQRKSFRLHGKGLHALATIITGQLHHNPVGKNQDLAKLSAAIYGESNLVVEEVNLEKDGWIEEIKRMYPTPEEFLALKQIQKTALIIYGKKLTNLATIITGISGLTPRSSRCDMAILAKAVYGEGHKVIEEGLKELAVCNWDREKWIEEIKNIYPTPEEFIQLTNEQKLNLKIHGKGLTYLATIIRNEAGLKPQGIRRDMAILAKAVYGEGHKVIEDVLKEAEKDDWDKEKWKEETLNQFPTYNEFMALTYKIKSDLKIHGKGLKSLATIITGNSKLDPVDSSTDMSVLARALYGEEHPIIQKTLSEEYAEIWSRERYIDEIKTQYPSPEEFMSLKNRERSVLKIHGKGLIYLSSLITGRTGLIPISSARDFAILAKEIYGEGHDVIEKALIEGETKGWSREKWIEEIKKQFCTSEEFMKLTAKQRAALNFFGKGLRYISSKIIGKILDPIGYKRDAEILTEAIYGDNDKTSDNS